MFCLMPILIYDESDAKKIKSVKLFKINGYFKFAELKWLL
jgi:hypothetical protein